MMETKKPLLLSLDVLYDISTDLLKNIRKKVKKALFMVTEDVNLLILLRMTFTDEQKKEIITLYKNKYYDATFAYACELLSENEDINFLLFLSVSHISY